MAVASCGGNGDVGESCENHADCASGLQCFDLTCVPRCDRHADCGDGHICRADEICELVTSEIGDDCSREVDCGPGQACHLNDEVFGGALHASCQRERAGNVLDASCTDDDDCRTGTCVIGRCVDLCVDDSDCPDQHVCPWIQRELDDDEVADFQGCLPASGNIVYPVPFTVEYDRFFLPVPSNATSVALVSSLTDPTQLVGAARVESPTGELLYQLPLSREEYFQNRLRHEPTTGVSTLIIPQTPDPVASLVAGAYVVELGSYIDLQTPGTEIPVVDVIYKLSLPTQETIRLPIHFYFLDLEEHPCAAGFDDGTLDAAAAQAAGSGFQTFATALKGIFNRNTVQLEIETATYADITGRPDLDALSEARLGDLLSLSDEDGGISVFFVRTLSPAGLQGLVGGPPCPPGRSGTRASGIVIGVDTLCYRTWIDLARTTAHEIARSLGLQRNIEPDGYTDSIAGSDSSSDNLMYYSEFGGDDLDPDQQLLLRKSPAVQ